MRRPLRSRARHFAFATLLGLASGLACASSGGGQGGQVQSVSGSSACPRGAVPRSGTSCPRGSVDFCVYRTTGGDYACTCGKGWSCARK